MRLRSGYKRLLILWAVIALPSLYYGIPYSEGDITPKFDNISGVIMWIIAAAILLLPIISLPFFLKKDNEDHSE
jgi:hypothetical protein